MNELIEALKSDEALDIYLENTNSTQIRSDIKALIMLNASPDIEKLKAKIIAAIQSI